MTGEDRERGRRRARGAPAGLAYCTLLAVACGGSSSGGGPLSVPGTDQVGLVGTTAVNGASVAYAGVVLTTAAEACMLSMMNQNVANGASLSVVVTAAGGGSVAPGTYPVSTAPAVGAAFLEYDANCATRLVDKAQSGTITLTAVGAKVAGSFDLAFATGDRLSGIFSAPVCNASLTPPGVATCIP